MKRTLIAAAVFAAAAGSAIAAPPKVYLFNTTGVHETVGIRGWVRIFGCVTVTSTAGAVVNNTQTVMLPEGTSLDPNYHSYTLGAVTKTYNNEDKNVSVTGSASYSASESFSKTWSSQWNASHTSTHDSSSATAWASAESRNTQSSSDTQHASSSSDTSANSGHESVAGVLTGTVATSASTSETHTHTGNHRNGGSSENVNFNGSLYVSGAAGVAWDGASSKGTTHNDTSSSSTNTSSSMSESGYHARVHHDETASTASSSKSGEKSRSEQFSVNQSWSYNLDLDQTDVTKTGSVTHYTDTRQAGVLNAGTGSNAASGVTGNLGVNVAEGIDNAQSNDVSLASVDIGNVFGNAQIFSKQSSAGSASVNNFKLNATVGDGSLSNVSGNVGVNVASGIGNVQNNSLAGSVTTINATQAQTVAMVATDDNTQTAAAGASGRFEGNAVLGANTLHNSTGNIGVNIAGGVGNLQHNGLAIAALNNGH
ncbi:cell wall anchor protein [Burkholderia sp. Ac-20353]|uniref:cell wall anchor protein n=1 Tax=Burkholderia sp. Ac-20353 TaxID=2703894 RepID=UPI00197B686B|nr:cell wall anchor protein [Burkholderia sp. Ac-20353]MBN3792604.1 cell wall anchor protein [Burkholderia sp. Ac-20353]